jgi:hypothetical protein
MRNEKKKERFLFQTAGQLAHDGEVSISDTTFGSTVSDKGLESDDARTGDKIGSA